jgi:hypothetical protein
VRERVEQFSRGELSLGQLGPVVADRVLVGSVVWWKPAAVVSLSEPSACCSIRKPGACLALWSRGQPVSRFEVVVLPLGHGIRWSTSASVADTEQFRLKQVPK